MGPELISALVQQVNEDRLRRDVARLADGQRHSLYSPASHSQAIEFISDVFTECGLATRKQSYEQGGRLGVNVVGQRAGERSRDLRPLLVSAHYDTVCGSPGGDDNASGVAAMLECARAMSSARLGRHIEFVAFDMEEKQPPDGIGLVGSTAFVKALGHTKAYEGLYNLEMVGYTSGPGTQGHPPGFRFLLPRAYKWVRQRGFLGDFIAVVAQGPGIDLSRRFAHAARQWVQELEVLPIELGQRIPFLGDIFRSDHAPFWAAGIPAIMITDTANFRNPNYHRPTDTPETLDYTLLANVTRTLVATLAGHGELL